MKNLPNINISVVPHNKHRKINGVLYNTCGDYFKKNKELHVRISKMGAKHEFLVAMHELIEWFLIEQKGVTIEQIDKFDIEFEENRPKDNTDEPGDDPKAPYYNEHQFATRIEKMLADYLGVNWNKYTEFVNKL